MPVDRVLVQGKQHVQLVTNASNRPIAGQNRQEGVAAADDRLISIVSIYVQPAAGEDPGQDVARAGDALPVFAANPNCKVFFFSSRRRHTRLVSDWSSDVCSSD